MSSRGTIPSLVLTLALFLAAVALSALSGMVLLGNGSAGDADQTRSFATGVGIGLVLAVGTWRFLSLRWLRDVRYLLLLVAVALAGLLLAFGTGPRGTDTRIILWGVQPVELIKLLVVFFLASYFASRDLELRRLESTRVLGVSIPRLRDVMPVVVGLAVTLALFFLQRDLGPALVLYLVFVGMFIAASGRVVLGLMGLAGLLAAFWATYQLRLLQTVSTRIEMWLSPWDNHRPGGVQLAESLWALASGGTDGSGLGRAMLRYIPAGHTDLILAATGETFGVAAVVGVLAVLGVIVLLIAWQSHRAAGSYERYLAFGLLLLLGTQTALIAGATLGLVPLTGVPVPFMSYGKSATIVQFLAIGVIGAIARQTPTGQARMPLSRWAALPLLLIVSAFGAIGWRAWQVMTIEADAILVRGALTPQGDGVRRFSYNRRVMDLVRDLPRGRVLDQHGVVLAEDEGATRRYPLGEVAPQVIGHSRAVWADARTVERDRADDLRGFVLPELVVTVDGLRTLQRDYAALVPVFRKRFVSDGPVQQLRARNRDVSLTLDANLQRLAFDALQKNLPTVRGERRTRAAGIVLDARTGAIRAAVSLPTYDPNAIDAEALDRMFGETTRAALDRARFEVYPPGSTFKLVTAAAGLDAGIGPDRTTICPHQARLTWDYQRRQYRRQVTDDVQEGAHGAIGMGKAVEESCNVYFATLGTWIGPEALLETARERFGLALKDIPSAVMMGEHLADHAYGQALVTVTPLEMATVAAAIANGGSRVMPSLYPLQLARSARQPRALKAEHAALLRRWMEAAVRSGTGRRAAVEGLVVAGKTGTAQTESGDGASHAWFVGFAHRPGQPEEEALAFAFVIENGGYGGRAAAQTVHDFLEAAFTR